MGKKPASGKCGTKAVFRLMSVRIGKTINAFFIFILSLFLAAKSSPMKWQKSSFVFLLFAVLISSFAEASAIDPSILKTLKDSGALDRNGRTGYWIIYTIDSTYNEEVNMADLTRYKIAQASDVVITRYRGCYNKSKRTGNWIMEQCYKSQAPFVWIKRGDCHFKNNYLNGSFRFYRYEGDLLYETNYRNDLLEGKFKQYYPSGQLQFTFTLRKGVNVGDFTSYYESGELMSRCSFGGGYLNGEYNIYYKNKTIKSSVLYDRGIPIQQVECNSIWGDHLPCGNIEYGTGTILLYSDLGHLFSKENWVQNKKSGKQYYYHSNGQISREVEYIKGVETGAIKDYSRDGIVLFEGNVQEGLYHGDNTWYYPNGKIKVKLKYNSGKILMAYFTMSPTGDSLDFGKMENGIGLLKLYDDSARVRETIHFFDEIKNGKRTLYYSNGNLEYENEYCSDTLCKIQTRYHPDGKIDSESTIVNGEYTGIQTNYYLNGKVKSKYEMIGGLIWNVLAQYDTSGKIIDYGTLRNGFGTLITYSDTGYLASRGEYKFGSANGKEISYFRNGEIMRECYFSNNLLHGECKNYEPGNILRFLTYYVHGLKQGNCYVYHLNGQIWTERVYHKDELMSITFNYDANGKEQYKGTLNKGNGTRNEYDESGKLIKVAYYEYGFDLEEMLNKK
jgi:uncharacterized protein